MISERYNFILISILVIINNTYGYPVSEEQKEGIVGNITFFILSDNITSQDQLREMVIPFNITQEDRVPLIVGGNPNLASLPCKPPLVLDFDRKCRKLDED
ncbi:uncharacterized protein LOC115890276 [Sitophilus oryzae]|uniref:Uncharacterized protein LOC115890276 n=1 Tax=Sitophilus oryzae TaxID=7048 RepID=A0A6J2YU15_SITOR|nr:uncharacterized protein LOC115890276 [Sitophilus oryzae]